MRARMRLIVFITAILIVLGCLEYFEKDASACPRIGIDYTDSACYNRFLAALRNMRNSVIRYMSRMLNSLGIGLALLWITIRLLFYGWVDALRVGTEMPSSVVDEQQTSLQTCSSSTESMPKIPVEGGSNEPRNQHEISGFSHCHSGISSRIDPDLASAGVHQAYYVRQPITMLELVIFQWEFHDFAQILRAYMCSSDYALRVPKRFEEKVFFIRSNMRYANKLTVGLTYVKKIFSQVKKGVEDLNAISVNVELLRVARALQKAEGSFELECEGFQLTRNIEHIDDVYSMTGFRKTDTVNKYDAMVFKTAQHINSVLTNNNVVVEKFLNDVRDLSETYNLNREEIIYMATP